jgi:hypothetical protein
MEARCEAPSGAAWERSCAKTMFLPRMLAGERQRRAAAASGERQWQRQRQR